MQDLIYRLISFESFSSVWYWILFALAWSGRAHYVMSVPYDSVIRAERHPDEWTDDLDQIARLSARRYRHFVQRGGVVMFGVLGFLIAVMCVGAFYYSNEMSQAIMALSLPIILAQIYEFRLAGRVLDIPLAGRALRKEITWRRFYNQVIGLCGILIAASFAGLNFLQVDGISLFESFNFWGLFF